MPSPTSPARPSVRDRSVIPSSPVRASDAEREEVVATLHEALGTGRLDLAETDERVADAYAARFRHELAVLVHDLPPTATAGRFGADRVLIGTDRAKAALRAVSTRAARRPLVVAAAVLIGIGGVAGASLIEDGPSGPPGVAHVHDHIGAPLPR